MHCLSTWPVTVNYINLDHITLQPGVERILVKCSSELLYWLSRGILFSQANANMKHDSTGSQLLVALRNADNY